MIENFNDRLKEFLQENGTCLILEPSPTFLENLQTCLANLGIPLSRVTTSRRPDDAFRLLKEKRPKILITEYEVPGGSGLSLIEAHESLYDETERVSMIVTKNSSDSAIMHAAEGSADAFVLKPFSTETFQQKLAEVLERKAFPTPYEKALQEGRKLLKDGHAAEALSKFAEAETFDVKPSMACYLMGLAQKTLGNKEAALHEFRRGQKFQPLHYRCLTAEFDLLIEQENYADAAILIPLIRHNYPVSESRLGQIFIASVFTYQFEDLPDYYRLALEFEDRSPWINELMTLAFLTAGKFWLRKKDLENSVKAFEHAIAVQGKALTTIETAIDELLKAEAITEALSLFERVLPSDVGTALYSQVRFKLDLRTHPASAMIEPGRRLIAEGMGTPEIFRQVVRIMASDGKDTLAESMIAKAREADESLATELYEILKTHFHPRSDEPV